MRDRLGSSCDDLSVEAHTAGSPHVLNVVEGSFVVLETPGAPPQRFAFAETFIVPATTGTYRLVNDTGHPAKVVKAFLKPQALVVTGEFAV